MWLRGPHGLILFINFQRILTLFKGKTYPPLQLHFLLTLITIIGVISKRRLVMFHLLHLVILFLNYETVCQFRCLFYWDILGTLYFLLGTTFLPQRCTWLDVVSLRGCFWISLFIFIVVTIPLLLLEIFRFFVLEFYWVGGWAWYANVLFSKVMA